MNSRLERCARRVREKGEAPFLFFDLVNIRYLTGFKGTNGYLVIDQKNIFFITDSRYEEYARSILPDEVTFERQEGQLVTLLSQLSAKYRWKTLFLEDHSLILSNFLVMKESIEGVNLEARTTPVQKMRVAKDEDELQILREAAAIADRCVDHIVQTVKPGMSEWDLSVEIEYFYRKNGCTGSSFETIVASGTHSSMPHHATSMDKIIQDGDVLLIDMGCTYKGYNSDLTRTLFMGNVDKNFELIYNTVNNARETAIRAVKPGMKTGELDSIARTIITDAGFGEYFGHSLGHGIGLEVHEFPRLKPEDDYVLPENCVFSVEPGIYLPGKGGVRIEDMVCTTPDGYEIMTRSSREITVI
jgi:Xaa-Pro aminopeptidase